MGTKTLQLKLEKNEADLFCLKILANGYGFENITDYLYYTIERGVMQDIEQHNRLSAEKDAYLKAREEAWNQDTLEMGTEVMEGPGNDTTTNMAVVPEST